MYYSSVSSHNKYNATKPPDDDENDDGENGDDDEDDDEVRRQQRKRFSFLCARESRVNNVASEAA